VLARSRRPAIQKTRVIVVSITVFEVGPRDGIQAAKADWSLTDKVKMINELHSAGINNIEVGSFVHPRYVPNMANSDDVFKNILHLKGNFSVLIPNERGFVRAKSVGAKKFNVCLSPSESFNKNNFNSSLNDLLASYRSMLYGIDKDNIRVYISNAFGCPIDGQCDDKRMRMVLEQCALLGSTVVLSDTSGLATKESIEHVMSLTDGIFTTWAIHLHHNDNGDSLIPNVEAAYQHGIREFDSSIGGLGGCPFAPGSGANLATEDLLSWAIGQNISITDRIDFSKVKTLGQWVQQISMSPVL